MTTAAVAPSPARARPALITVLAALFVVLVLVGLGFAASWRANGGRWAIVETPSMGQAIPVGSLIVTRPTPISTVRIGDVVTYRPGVDRSLYTHRVVAFETGVKAGALWVQGDNNNARDPFPVTQDMLVGKVVGHWQGLGWLMRALPLVLVAVAVLMAATRLWAPTRWRSSIRILGTCVIFAVVSLLLHPFVNIVLMSAVSKEDADGTHVQATVVSTGLLPIRATGLSSGPHVDLKAGQIGRVPVLPAAKPGGPVAVNARAHLTGWWLFAVIVTSLSPMLWVLVFGLAPGAPRTRDGSEEGAVEPAAVEAGTLPVDAPATR